MIDLYEANIVKKYQYWTVYVNANQDYLGRCVIWCNREDALDLAEATQAEGQEFHQILKGLKDATTQLFGATWFNYALLGNVDRHLHCHFLPRYETPATFAGMKFVDEDYTANPFRRNTQNIVPKEALETIRIALAEVL